ncbi:hypothetical protein ACIQ2D_21550 [Lysinibacillus sp. NPDC097287]|uniref:hypothetical protein n=1 Tax=Lysinibacillus sp. NPDC097287 TaxID=3364144 RepID=UPI00382C32E5
MIELYEKLVETTPIKELEEQIPYDFIENATKEQLADSLYKKTEELVLLRVFIDRLGLTDGANAFIKAVWEAE